MKFLDVGYKNLINAARIVSIASFDSAPIKRLSQDAKEAGMAIDVTCGHKCRSVIVTDSRHVILSALEPEFLMRNRNILSEPEQSERSDTEAE